MSSSEKTSADTIRRKLEANLRADPRDTKAMVGLVNIFTNAYSHHLVPAIVQRCIAAHGSVAEFRKSLGLRVVMTVSNCQGKPLIDAMSAIPDFNGEWFNIGFYNVDINAMPPDLLGIADLLLFQTMTRNSGNEERIQPFLAGGGRVIRFPAATSSVLWPFYYPTASRTDAEGRPVYRYAYGDRYIERAVKQGVPAPQVVQDYMDLDISSATNLQRLIEIEGASERSKESESHVKLRDFIEAHSRERPMFHTPNHPVQEVICHAAKQVLGELGLAFNAENLPTREYPITSKVTHPVHPGVVEFLQLSYFGPAHVFRMARGSDCTFQEFIPRYIEGSI